MVCLAESLAALIAYDGFSSSVYDGTLAGQNPVVAGFDGAWTPGVNIDEGDASLAWPADRNNDSR